MDLGHIILSEFVTCISLYIQYDIIFIALKKFKNINNILFNSTHLLNKTVF